MREGYINCFIETAIHSGGWMLLDKVFLRNHLISLIGDWTDLEEKSDLKEEVTTADLLSELIDIAKQNNRIDVTIPSQLEPLKAQLMELLTPPPSVVNALFSKHYDSSSKEATDYFYLLNKNNGYVADLSQSEETISISSNEWLIRHKKESLAQENECQQCFDSEGFGCQRNRIKRIIRMNLKGESWGMYYQPDSLVSEHSIFSTEEHIPFDLTRQNYTSMLRLVDIYPDYFMSFDPIKNENREHGFLFGGDLSLPLVKADDDYVFDIPGFVTVKASLVDWPLSVIRLRTKSTKNLLNSIEYLNLRWQQYSYPSLDIIATDKIGKSKHSFIPVFYKEGEEYVVELILRDTSSSFKRNKEYENLLFDPDTIVDMLGVINLKEGIILTNDLKELIQENIKQQSIFKKSPEGQKAFIRFIDTL